METIKNICLFRPEYILIVLILSFLLGCESEKQIKNEIIEDSEKSLSSDENSESDAEQGQIKKAE